MTGPSPIPRVLRGAIAAGCGVLIFTAGLLLTHRTHPAPTPPRGPAPRVLNAPPAAPAPPPIADPRAGAFPAFQAFAADFAAYLQGHLTARQVRGVSARVRAQLIAEHRPTRPVGADEPGAQLTAERIERPAPGQHNELYATVVIDLGYSQTPISVILRPSAHGWVIDGLRETG